MQEFGALLVIAGIVLAIYLVLAPIKLYSIDRRLQRIVKLLEEIRSSKPAS